MVNINSSKVTIGGRSYGKDKSSYPAIPTVFSGVEVQWGAASCIEHPDPSRATLSLWVPKTHEDYVPDLGDVVAIDANLTAGGDLLTSYDRRIFTGKVESVKLQDDHKTPTILIPNSRDMTTNTGWISSYSPTVTSGWTSFVSGDMVVTNGKSLTLPFKSATQRFWVKPPQTPVVAGKTYTFSYNSNWVGSENVNYIFYNDVDAVVSSGGMTVDAAAKTASITAPATATKVTLEIVTSLITKGNGSSQILSYVVGPVTLAEAGVAATGGYRINVTAADALAEAGRLRLSSTPLPYEAALNRQARVANLATKAGVQFSGGLTEEQGYYDALGTFVTPRDMDSFPALEAFQRATMASGHTVLSSNNIVQPSLSLKLPRILSASQAATGIVYSYNPAGAGTHEQKTNGVLTRTNWATNATGTTNSGVGTSQYYSARYGTGGVGGVYVGDYENPKNGSNTVLAQWFTDATGGDQGITYKQTGITGASGSRVSGGMWVRFDPWTGSASRTFNLKATVLSGVTPVGTVTASNVALTADTWTWLPVSGVTATAAYDTVEIALTLATGNMLASDIIYTDGVLIEKTATAGAYFDAYSLEASAVVVPVDRDNISVFPASTILDDVFELDTSQVINEIKVECKKVDLTTNPDTVTDFDQVFTDDVGSKNTTPQSRSITTDWAVNAADGDLGLAASVMSVKGNLLLAGQSKPQWRLSSTLSLILDEVETQENIYMLLGEMDRFGALIKITGAPSLVPEYMRVRGGRIVLGEEPALELDLEPVEYSAPVPLNAITLQQDFVASNYRFRNAKTITFTDLRTISAR